MSKLLRRTLFGNPILRQVARRLSHEDILSQSVQELIADMRYTLEKRKYGVGLAAPQVGHGLALSVIGIKPTPSRPDNDFIDLVVINPEIIKTYGKFVPKWEGCLSFGEGSSQPYAQAQRYDKVRIRFYDERGEVQERTYDGLLGHVLQHEIDHLHGILFVDRVTDAQSYITISEYRKHYQNKLSK